MLSQTVSYKNKRVLICPLDWGLGHVARCVPIIKHLQAQNNTVIVGCTQIQKEFLQKEITDVEFVDLFGYNVSYSKSLPLWTKMLLQFPRLCITVRKENRWLKNFLKKNKVDVVISDNRFGLYNNDVETVFITHQVFIKAPTFQKTINSINHFFIKKFNACWIPDYEEKEKSLSGELSHGTPVNKNTVYIGPLSRFSKKKMSAEKIYDLLILLSGVEPQRTLLEEKLVEVITNSALKIVLVRGSSIPAKKSFPKNYTAIDVASSHQLQELFLGSEKIMCRSGYSSLMDLHALDLHALLIPTPGQTEQEYLAEYWKTKFGYDVLPQGEIEQKIILNLFRKKENSQPLA